MAEIGAPVVTPLRMPLITSGSSVSERWVVRSDEPGARRRIWMRTASMSMASPAGTPSSTTPIAGAVRLAEDRHFYAFAIGIHAFASLFVQNEGYK